MPGNVRIIPATVEQYTEQPLNSVKKKRVAAYARVSTELEEQQSSFRAQVNYYTDYIKRREDWEFAGMYTDDGISGTNMRKRDGFNKMIKDALAGKIDLIITKSVSRFARNTVDSLTTVRKLKAKGIEVYFEKENIWTLDSKGELLITIMSSLAQEESRSISENVTWGHRKRFAAGSVSVAYSHFLGYDRGKDGKMVINPEQAEVVRKIYRLFLSGYTYHSIARQLTEAGIPTPGGKTIWRAGGIRSILTNEKYKGDALLQKQFTVDFLNKKVKKNEGEIPQYYVEGDHEAIISPAAFDMVQREIQRRRGAGSRHSGVSIFSSKIKCGDCGGWYGAKVWHSNDRYRRIIYQCNHKFKGTKCQTPYVTEDQIKELFIKAANKLISDKGTVLKGISDMRKILDKSKELESKMAREESELNDLNNKLKILLGQNVEDGSLEYSRLASRYEELRLHRENLLNQLEICRTRDKMLETFATELRRSNLLQVFDERLWCVLLDYITVHRNGEIEFFFKNKTVIKT